MADGSSSLSKPNDGPRRCKACAITFPDIYSYTEHLESKDHTEGVMKKRYGKQVVEAKIKLYDKTYKNESDDCKNENSKNSDEEGEVYTCEDCKKVCTGIVNYQQHLFGKNHMKTKKKKELMEQMKRDKTVDDNDDSDEHDLMKLLFPNSKEMSCNACSKSFTGPEPYKQHITSEGHKKNLYLQNLLKEIGHNKSTTGNSQCDDDANNKCDVCCKNFSGSIPYLQHINSASHLKQVEQTDQLNKFKDLLISFEDSNKLQCKECNKYFSGPKPFEDHLKSSLHRKLKLKSELLKQLLEKHPEIEVTSTVDDDDNDPMIVCTICHTKFSGPESARDHFDSQKHKKIVRDKKMIEKLGLSKGSKQSKTKSKSKTDDNKIDENNDSSDDFDIIG